jgi:hypothetical protein
VSRESSPLLLRVSVGLGLVVAAATSTVRADPGLMTELHHTVFPSHSAPSTPLGKTKN